MRFDKLDDEYKIVCEKLNIPYESLQNLGKFPYKKKNEEYWKYYNYESGSVVAYRHRKSIEKFKYTCGLE